jgi:hypothetical protein
MMMLLIGMWYPQVIIAASEVAATKKASMLGVEMVAAVMLLRFQKQRKLRFSIISIVGEALVLSNSRGPLISVKACVLGVTSARIQIGAMRICNPKEGSNM